MVRGLIGRERIRERERERERESSAASRLPTISRVPMHMLLGLVKCWLVERYMHRSRWSSYVSLHEIRERVCVKLVESEK
jgi:hypothetical protein